MIDPKERYGFMRDVECDLIDRILDQLENKFGNINFLEIGTLAAGTPRGIYRRASEIGCPAHCSGVDFEQYRPNPILHENYTFYAGDSMDIWREIPVNSNFNLLLIDGCHCVNHSMADFLNYSPFIVVNGFCLFHDTALPTGKAQQEAWPQDHSYAGKPNSNLGVREGLKKMGILQGHRTDWELIEEIDGENGLMGMMSFRKLKEL